MNISKTPSKKFKLNLSLISCFKMKSIIKRNIPRVKIIIVKPLAYP